MTVRLNPRETVLVVLITAPTSIHRKKENVYSVDHTPDVKVNINGTPTVFPTGSVVEIKPGNRITLFPYIYHDFFAKEGDGDLLVGEVSTINDDRIDNFFADSFTLPPITEDEQPIYPLCNGYQQ